MGSIAGYTDEEVVGLRVVRGPNWKWGAQDGGEGFVGTVVKVAEKNSKYNIKHKKTKQKKTF
jgi:hypothetical protein